MVDHPDTRPSAGFAPPPTPKEPVQPKVPAPMDPPRGRLLAVDVVLERFFDPKTIKERWLRDNLPYKVELGPSTVGWREKDVEEVLAIAARDGIPIRQVRLPYYEEQKRHEQAS